MQPWPLAYPASFRPTFQRTLPNFGRVITEISTCAASSGTYLDKAPIQATSILNGAFAEILTYNIPLLDIKQQQVGYWEDADWKIDFTTMDNTAAFTAAAALDPTTPRFLRIASFPNQC